MQTYLETHPWITFTLDLSKSSYRLWMLLGEAKSKCEHIAGIPLMPAVAETLHSMYLAKGAHASTAIEGNTLTEKEVLAHLEGKLKLLPSEEYLAQEVDNVIQACNEIARQVFQKHLTKLNVPDIEKYNGMVLKNLPVPDHVTPGQIRTSAVGVARYLAVRADECKDLLHRLCDWLNNDFHPVVEHAVAFNILKSIVAHVYLAWIHPFGDGNGRTARLIEFQLLLSAGVPSAAAHLLSNHYNQTRSEYYRQLDLASKSGGDLKPFIEYALHGFVDGLKAQIEVIRSQQWTVHWRDFIFDSFKDKNSAADLRRRHLILDLSTKGDELIPISKIRYISPRVAEAYSKKTQKTVTRDIQILDEMGLLVRKTEGLRVRKEIILAFLPPSLQA